MNRSMYNKALRYAFMLMPYHENYYDLVHDAFLAYHKSTGLNLFDQEERTVIATVKNVWYNYMTKNRYQKHGVRDVRQFVPVSENDRVIVNTPDVALEARDSVEWLYKEAQHYYGTLSVKNPQHKQYYQRAFEDTEEIVNLKYQGYKQNEISERIDTSSTTIKKYMDVLKEIIIENPETPFDVSTYNNYNPFNGSKVKVTKTLLGSTYNSGKNDKYAEFEYNTDNGADYNEFYVLLTHKELGNESGLLIRNTDKVRIVPRKE